MKLHLSSSSNTVRGSAGPSKCVRRHAAPTPTPSRYSGRGVAIITASAPGSTEEAAAVEVASPVAAVPKKKPVAGGKVNLFDPAATASRFLTRRFGIVGGLGFVALLASTEGWEIIKAALEREEDGDGQLVLLPSGLSYRDIKVGGGPSPQKGDFVGAHFLVKAEGEDGAVLFDTHASGSKPIAFTLGRRPYSSVVCAGVEEGVATMRRGGVRELLVPAQLGFGAEGKVLAPGVVIPPGATLSYTISLEDVTPSYL